MSRRRRSLTRRLGRLALALLSLLPTHVPDDPKKPGYFPLRKGEARDNLKMGSGGPVRRSIVPSYAILKQAFDPDSPAHSAPIHLQFVVIRRPDRGVME